MSHDNLLQICWEKTPHGLYSGLNRSVSLILAADASKERENQVMISFRWKTIVYRDEMEG